MYSRPGLESRKVQEVLFCHIQKGSGTHSASYSTGIRFCFFQEEKAGAWNWPGIFIYGFK